MPRQKDLHHDNGGRCDYCWEEWPCAQVTFGWNDEAKPGMGLWEWQQEGEAKARERRFEEFQAAIAPALTSAKVLGLPEMSDTLEGVARDRYRRSPPNYVDVAFDELCWLLEAAAGAGLRYPYGDAAQAEAV